jgi:hypothetical protein
LTAFLHTIYSTCAAAITFYYVYRCNTKLLNRFGKQSRSFLAISLQSQSLQSSVDCCYLSLLFRAGFAVPPRLYLRHTPPSSPTLLMHLTSHANIDIYHAALSLLLRPLRLPPRGLAFLASSGSSPVEPRPGRTSTIGLHRADDDTMMTSTTVWPARRDA